VAYKGTPVILVHTEEGFSAFDAACTHLGCIVKWVRNEKIFYCPCHAGKFDVTGKVTSGPPPEPLHRIDIKVLEDKIVFL
ncbi:MAG: Rieske 2Fe-2S domain-containing protein, partial [Nitrospinaceae bacterium]